VAAAAASSPPAVMLDTRRGRLAILSIAIKQVRAAIHSRCAPGTTTIVSIRHQQVPTQLVPCLRPNNSAPRSAGHPYNGSGVGR
jgi:hypothetical protein